MEHGEVDASAIARANDTCQAVPFVAVSDKAASPASRTPPERSAEAESDRSLPQQARSQVERPSETSGRSARSEPPPGGERSRPVQGRWSVQRNKAAKDGRKPSSGTKTKSGRRERGSDRAARMPSKSSNRKSHRAAWSLHANSTAGESERETVPRRGKST